jgi:hypothetical protein
MSTRTNARARKNGLRSQGIPLTASSAGGSIWMSNAVAAVRIGAVSRLASRAPSSVAALGTMER